MQKYHISLAQFDNCDIPIKDESLNYITCTFALNYLYNETNINLFQKALKEVHRVLIEGGRLVAVEHMPDFELDMTRIYQECQPSGILYGLYPYETLKQVQKDLQDKRILKKRNMRDQFLSTSFKIGVETNIDVDDDKIKQISCIVL